jgi:transposase InsO family protein
MESQLTMNALTKALRDRWTESATGLIHHSDQGVQYASRDYVDCLKKHNIQISSPRKGNPYDNAFAFNLYQPCTQKHQNHLDVAEAVENSSKEQ